MSYKKQSTRDGEQCVTRIGPNWSFRFLDNLLEQIRESKVEDTLNPKLKSGKIFDSGLWKLRSRVTRPGRDQEPDDDDARTRRSRNSSRPTSTGVPSDG